MAALLEDAPPRSPSELGASLATEAQRHSSTGEAIKAKMTDLVKGAGMATIGSNTPLTDQTDIIVRAHEATLGLRSETHRGFHSKSSVVKGMNQGFLSQFGHLKTALSAPSLSEQIAQALGSLPGGDAAAKSFTAGNLGIAGAVSGLVPFDLLAPSRLIS